MACWAAAPGAGRRAKPCCLANWAAQASPRRLRSLPCMRQLTCTGARCERLHSGPGGRLSAQHVDVRELRRLSTESTAISSATKELKMGLLPPSRPARPECCCEVLCRLWRNRLKSPMAQAVDASMQRLRLACQRSHMVKCEALRALWPSSIKRCRRQRPCSIQVFAGVLPVPKQPVHLSSCTEAPAPAAARNSAWHDAMTSQWRPWQHSAPFRCCNGPPCIVAGPYDSNPAEPHAS